MRITRKIVLYWVDGHDTEKAYSFMTEPGGSTQLVWIPRSVVKHVSKDLPDQNRVRRCTIEVEEWFLEKNGL